MASAPEILLKFEQTAFQFDPVVLVWPGVVMLCAGLVLWIAGLKMAKVCAVLLAIIAGGALGFVLVPESAIGAAFLGAAVLAVSAFIFDKFMMTLLGSLLTGVFVLGFVLCFQFKDAQFERFPNAPHDGRLSQSQSLEVIGKIADYFWAETKRFTAAMPKIYLLLPAAAVLLIWVGAMAMARMAVALSCSVTGSVLVVCGMIFLLFFKGSGPLSYFYIRPAFFMVVLGGMIVLGTFIQLLLCSAAPPAKSQITVIEIPNDGKVKHA